MSGKIIFDRPARNVTITIRPGRTDRKETVMGFEFDHTRSARARHARHDNHVNHPVYRMLMDAARSGYAPRPEDVEELELPQRLADRLYLDAHKVTRTYYDRDRGRNRLMDARRQADKYAERIMTELTERHPLYRTPAETAHDSRTPAEIADEVRQRSLASGGGTGGSSK